MTTTKEAKCRYCQRALHVEVDASLDELGVGAMLQSMASCDRCATFREKRRKLLEALKTVCETIHTRGRSDKDADSRDVVTKLLQRYMELVSKYRDIRTPPWDDSITDSLLHRPMQYQEVINNLTRICKAEKQLL